MRNPAHVIGVCALAAILALIVVGYASHGIARHILQTLPLWPAVVLGLSGRPEAKWAGIPVFIFWLAIMTLVWLYLLGISRVAFGTYGQIEIAMTLVVGLASVSGLIACNFSKFRASRTLLLGAVVLFAVQIGVMTVSLYTPIANDRTFMTSLRS